MYDSDIRPRRKKLFDIDFLELGERLRREGVSNLDVLDAQRRNRVSMWLANQFRDRGLRLDPQDDIAIQVAEHEWRILDWPKQEYAYRIERQGQIFNIYISEQPHLRVLSLDAGGIAGYFNARLLQKIHNRVKEKVRSFQQAFRRFKSSQSIENQAKLVKLDAYIHNLQSDFLDDVDYLMGTSAGSVNAAILAQHDQPTTQLHRCIQVWREPRLFDNEPLSNLMAIYGLRSFVSFTKYKKSLSKYIPPDLTLHHLKKDALFTTFALDPRDDSPRSKPKIFNSADPDDQNELTLDVVLRSGSAAPIGAIHQGYADGGWYSASPSSHIIPLFRWFRDYVTEDQKRLREPLRRALKQDWFIEQAWKPLCVDTPVKDKNSYQDIIASLNRGELPKALRIPVFAKTSTHDLREVTQVDVDPDCLKEDPVLEDDLLIPFRGGLSDHPYTLTLENTGNGITAVLNASVNGNELKLVPEHQNTYTIEVSQGKKESWLAALRGGLLPADLRQLYFAQSQVIDFALHWPKIHIEQQHRQWRLEVQIGEDAEASQQFRIKATPTNKESLFSFEVLERQLNKKKLTELLETEIANSGACDHYIANLYDLCRQSDAQAHNEQLWELLHDQAVSYLIRKMEPPIKLSLLSVGVGIKNKRLVMPKEDYHWGYLHLLLPSPLNQFFSLGSALASAQADRATEEIRELDHLFDHLNFHRIDPGVLSLNQFAYSAAAIFPPLKDATLAQLEVDLSGMEVTDEVEKTAEWLFRYWILGDHAYQLFTDGSSARPRFTTRAGSLQPLAMITMPPDFTA